jgi:hypothetical protein
MYVMVYWPDAPLQAPDGTLVQGLGGGHVREEVAVGRVDTGDTLAITSDSGIRFERQGIVARAAHCHLIGGRTRTLSPNGDIDAFLLAPLLHWALRNVGTVPGPTDYLSGGFVAGKARQLWTGRQLPAVPA